MYLYPYSPHALECNLQSKHPQYPLKDVYKRQGIGCVFCKVHTDSYLGHYPKIPMIDKEDLIKGFAFINPNVNYVRLGAGVLVAPHTDPFLHPQIYDFIKIASEYFPTKKITTVTTGAYTVSYTHLHYCF